jgi:hypothetical protein
MKSKLILRPRIWLVVSILVLTMEVTWPTTTSAESGYSIRLVRVSPKRGVPVTVGDHVAVSITVKYKLSATDKGKVALVIQKDDNSLVMPEHQQVVKEVARGSGEATLSDEFDVPPGTSLIRLFVPLVPEGYRQTSGEIVIEYPVKQK